MTEPEQNKTVSGNQGNAKCRNGNCRKKGRTILKNEEIQCSGCSRWVKAGELDIVGMLRSKVDKIEVFCVRCMHGMFSVLRREIIKGRGEIKSLCRGPRHTL